ncbi:MAG: hypothetical protein L0G99_13760 [Propionibacteriales bacterium]|nr:hypothetical protein [Propionibacteriales bacterium]
MSTPRAVVVSCHGGRPIGWQRVGPWYPPVWWNQLLIDLLRHRLRPYEIALAPVINSVRGWNDPELPALDDARRTVGAIRRRWPDVPLLLIGYSLGGRVIGRIADEAGAAGAVALAPWWPDPVDGSGLAGVPTVIIQGSADAVTPPSDSRAVAGRLHAAGTPVVRYLITGAGHLMVLRRPTWQRLAGEGILGLLGESPYTDRLAAIQAGPRPLDHRC